ncbi:hypothetical protein RND81_05G106900 [Saponaria officinalis]|uniref:SHSP domain-containing protein n=1 Tax=Saponaria officinalis TaxID=3572 RepID=A0AAW1KW44_SAPOF
MASMAKMSIISSPQVVLNRASTGPLATNGLGPNAIMLPTSTKTKASSSRLSFAVKAMKYESDPHQDLKVNLTSAHELGDDLLHTSRFELTPWDYKEEVNKIKMWFNMPGVAAQDIRVYVKDQKLFIQGKHLLLPPNIRKEDITAKLGNGVLFVSVPKTKPDFEPLSIVVQPASW